jgi:hypothetical protein
MESPNGSNDCDPNDDSSVSDCEDGSWWSWSDGIYEIPHNNDPDANQIGMKVGAWGTTDDDFPYDDNGGPFDEWASLYYFHYKWTLTDGPSGANTDNDNWDDLTNVSGQDTPELSFNVSHPLDHFHEDVKH